VEVGVSFDIIQFSMNDFNNKIKQGSGVLLEKLLPLERDQDSLNSRCPVYYGCELRTSAYYRMVSSSGTGHLSGAFFFTPTHSLSSSGAWPPLRSRSDRIWHLPETALWQPGPRR